LTQGCADRSARPARSISAEAPRTFDVKGIVVSVPSDRRSAVIRHEAIPGYMAAMTMPFHVKDPAELRGVNAGVSVQFRFHVEAEQSWIDQVNILPAGPTGDATNAVPGHAAPTTPTPSPVASPSAHPLMDYKFTNQLGQPVSLSDFRGSALGITFIFTRCPVPDFCPRLTRNFQETSEKLSRLPNAPTNWHLLSFTIDPAFDTPKVLKGYAERFGYDPARWSFLTGPAEQVTALVRESGVTVTPEAGLFTHNFRTLIVGTNGQLLNSIPIGGPISDGIVTELLKAMGSSK
jgi:protein SCO1/2